MSPLYAHVAPSALLPPPFPLSTSSSPSLIQDLSLWNVNFRIVDHENERFTLDLNVNSKPSPSYRIYLQPRNKMPVVYLGYGNGEVGHGLPTEGWPQFGCIGQPKYVERNRFLPKIF